MTVTSSDFLRKLEDKVHQQLNGRMVGYLLGAGSSYLDGAGYPLASQVWDLVRDRVDSSDRDDIQEKLDEGAASLEQALDTLDRGGVTETSHRHSVTEAIADLFTDIDAPLETHRQFLARVSRRQEYALPVMTLNYDPLLERAAERERVRLFDGFQGVEHAYFDPELFQQRVGSIRRGRRHFLRFHPLFGVIYLYKLHGSVGWYECPTTGTRRCSYYLPLPPHTKRLMIPPQYRKAADTTAPPYSALWSEFRRLVRHGPGLVNRLVSIGYGLRDEHVNAVIDNALGRSDLMFLVFSRSLTDKVFSEWSQKPNVIIVTENRSSLYGVTGPGHSDLWSFERLSGEV